MVKLDPQVILGP